MARKPKSKKFTSTKRFAVTLDVAFSDKKAAERARKVLESALEEAGAKFYVLPLTSTNDKKAAADVG